jgi:hypothetical protein
MIWVRVRVRVRIHGLVLELERVVRVTVQD